MQYHFLASGNAGFQRESIIQRRMYLLGRSPNAGPREYRGMVRAFRSREAGSAVPRTMLSSREFLKTSDHIGQRQMEMRLEHNQVCGTSSVQSHVLWYMHEDLMGQYNCQKGYIARS